MLEVHWSTLDHRRFGRLAIGAFEVDKCILEVISVDLSVVMLECMLVVI
jgi:hypothetical protein